MLKHLSIKNYALIKHLEITPGAGLNIITGETGAGKSIMLGALGLLMGNRADTKALFDEEEKCIIEGEFDLKKLNIKSFFEENDLDFETNSIIRREIAPSGKSRAFINDTPVTLDILKVLGQYLMDIHSQHDTIMLSLGSFQLNLVDIYAQNQILVDECKEAFKDYKKSEAAFKKLTEEAKQLKKEFEYDSFQYEELFSAQLQNDEQEGLEEELVILENAEEIKRKLSLCFAYLNEPEQSALMHLKEANASLNSIVGINAKYAEFKERLTSSIIEIKDIIDDVERTEQAVETNEERLFEVKERINLIFKLLQKHGVQNIESLNVIKDELANKIALVTNLDENLVALKLERDQKLEIANKIATKLSIARNEVIISLTQNTEALLHELGMPDAKLNISIEEKELSQDGKDNVSFLFSANKGVPPKTLKEVASGGEFSRLMLAFKYILAEKSQLPTIIFDEIDTGISGEVANKVGKMMTEMAEKLQVVVITHLHQIAAKGNDHFFVYKDTSENRTVSKMKKLSQQERVKEIATMIGGEFPSETAVNSALEILELN